MKETRKKPQNSKHKSTYNNTSCRVAFKLQCNIFTNSKCLNNILKKKTQFSFVLCNITDGTKLDDYLIFTFKPRAVFSLERVNKLTRINLLVFICYLTPQ